MQFPNTIQYKQAVQDPESFATLNNDLHPVMDGYEPVLASGNFAVVFKMLQNGKKHALKCFTKESAGRADRQKMIVEYIKKNPSKYFVDYHYLENELWIAEGVGMEVPVTWMEWVEAPTLGEKIKDYCESKDTDGLQLLVENFREFALWILQQPFAHGDLKHDNLMVKEDGTLVMVDYDGMFIPDFDGLLANEMGSKGYQHPKRTADFFNNDLDDFSIAVIYISLLALVEDPELYHQYNNGQNIIFDSIDFINPAKSTLITHLIHSINPGVKVSELAQICKNHCQSIVNINKLIDRPFTRQEYLLELVETKKKILFHFEKLSINNKLGKLRLTEDILDSQITITRQLFENLQKKLPLKSFSEDTGVKEEWWNSLSEDWKKLVIINIENSSWWNFTEGRYITEESIKNTHKKIDLILDEFYFQQIYSKLSSLKIFTWVNGFEMDPIIGLKNLTAVRLIRPTDITAISHLEKLVCLCVDSANVNFEHLNNLPYLKVLDLNGSFGESLESFVALRHIEEMKFTYYLEMKPLLTMSNLKVLRLVHIVDWDFKAVAKMTSLKELEIFWSKGDISPIFSLNNLTRLFLCGADSSISSISSLKNLKELELRYNTADLNPLKSLSNITVLKLSENTAELSPIKSLTNLKMLDLSSNKSDIWPIKDLICSIINEGGEVKGIDINKFKHGDDNFSF